MITYCFHCQCAFLAMAYLYRPGYRAVKQVVAVLWFMHKCRDYIIMPSLLFLEILKYHQ